MKFRLLRYFVATAELGSVSRAAEKLFISQSPLSAQLRQLEEKMGVTLFVRQSRGVSLTAAGASFLVDARAILSRVDQAVERARETQSGKPLKLRFGLVSSTTCSVLPTLLRHLLHAGASVGIQASTMITSQQLRALRSDELDIGFGRFNEDDLPAETIAALDDPYCLAVPMNSRLAAESGLISLGAAAGEAFVAFTGHRDADYRDRANALCLEAGFEPDIQHEAGDWSCVLSLIGCGLSVGIVPASFSTLPSQGVAFRRIASDRHHGRLAVLANPRLIDDLAMRHVGQSASKALLELGSALNVYGSAGLTMATSIAMLARDGQADSCGRRVV